MIDRFYCDKTDRELYNFLDKEKMFTTEGNNRNRADQFLFAMAIGMKYDVRTKLDNRDGLFLRKDLNKNPLGWALMQALAIRVKGDPEALDGEEEIAKIAEEYAHGGIQLLAQKIKSTAYGTYDKIVEEEVVACLKQLPIESD